MTDEDWIKDHKKYTEQWQEYANKRKTKLRADQIEHDFINSPYETCTRCGTHRDQVMAGSASWLCADEMPKNCKHTGASSWNYVTNRWQCANCGEPIQPDSMYSAYYSTSNLEKDEPKLPKKCSCSIQQLMMTGCSCGGK